MSLCFADVSAPSIPLYPLGTQSFTDWCENQNEQVLAWIQSNGFSGKFGQTLAIADLDGRVLMALLGLGDAGRKPREKYAMASAVEALPSGVYHIEGQFDRDWLAKEMLGLLTSRYRFTKFAGQSAKTIAFKAPEGVNATQIEQMAAAEALTRDLINRPANDLGPAVLESEMTTLARQYGADLTVICGDALLENNFPLIHMVGAAAVDAPRLLDMSWGTVGPKLTLVGKGVCFDTGGLNLKSGASMGLMKKDMGGAAQVLGLAQMIMQSGMEIQLRVLVPAVENSVASHAMRPGDIRRARNGLSVEINNTDAEGRLVLADALTYADEDKPDLIISMATLTGAARVALGPDLPALFCDDPQVVDAFCKGGMRWADPLWHMPFWEPYESLIEPGIADLDNAPKGGMAGAITAALFLRRFAKDAARYAHIDLYGWLPSPSAGQAKGGVMSGPRAIFAALPTLLR